MERKRRKEGRKETYRRDNSISSPLPRVLKTLNGDTRVIYGRLERETSNHPWSSIVPEE